MPISGPPAPHPGALVDASASGKLLFSARSAMLAPLLGLQMSVPASACTTCTTLQMGFLLKLGREYGRRNVASL